ncbi:50S ribosomal protein L25 [Buchnera aphidicola (Thelaxes californica)]|uniref:Large ribosomal subunit protein bL25 n=1 Tax=Buchnera aphidicola (Thelaxes californica) TaxID=1315998 RepID=A0A4D6YC28_9GAMM|nr:50S ribosomal protein L25 [Buchnera aphidicola]QCI26662.1 50S ribosomal protein L25 [Buchnera aphidicola (Thelaxes californica)]
MLVIFAEKRIKIGKSSSRFLRNQNKIPAIIYGKKIIPVYISINQNIFSKVENTLHFDKNNINLNIDNIINYVVKIKEVQRHPFKKKLLHIDFLLK